VLSPLVTTCQLQQLEQRLLSVLLLSMKMAPRPTSILTLRSTSREERQTFKIKDVVSDSNLKPIILRIHQPGLEMSRVLGARLGAEPSRDEPEHNFRNFPESETSPSSLNFPNTKPEHEP
jgi:hypothetical protein